MPQYSKGVRKDIHDDLLRVNIDGWILTPCNIYMNNISKEANIAVDPRKKIKSNVLIIDDAVGSGATLNEVAKKIKKISSKDIKVVGYSVVGSFKGFDVISEV